MFAMMRILANNIVLIFFTTRGAGVFWLFTQIAPEDNDPIIYSNLHPNPPIICKVTKWHGPTIRKVISRMQCFKPCIRRRTEAICCNKTISQLQLQTEQEMEGVIEWILNNKLSLNIDKMQWPFHIKSESLILKIGTNQQEVKPAAKYLGELIDNQLTLKNHIEYVVDKLSAVAGIISKLKHYVPREVSKIVHCSIGFPHLMYGVLN